MAFEVAECILEQLQDTNKEISDYLSSIDRKFSQGQKTDVEDVLCIGKMATNHTSESPYASLTQQLQSFRHDFGMHDSAIRQVQVNWDFVCTFHNIINDGASN